MSKTLKREPDGIVDQDAAIMDYLAGLLDEQTDVEAVANRPAPARFPERGVNRGVNLSVIEPRTETRQPESQIETEAEPQPVALDVNAAGLSAGTAEPEARSAEEIALEAEQVDSAVTDSMPIDEVPTSQSEPSPTSDLAAEEMLDDPGAERITPSAEEDSFADVQADVSSAETTEEPFSADSSEEATQAGYSGADPEQHETDIDATEQAVVFEPDAPQSAASDEQNLANPDLNEPAHAGSAMSADEAHLADMVQTELADEPSPIPESEADPVDLTAAEAALSDTQQAEQAGADIEADVAQPDTPSESEDPTLEAPASEDVAPGEAADALFDQPEEPPSEPVGVEQDFAVLFVGKMQFLLPREQVADEFDLTQTPAPVGGAPEFVAGQIGHNGNQVLLIDLAALSGIKPHKNTPRKVVLLGGKGLWGVVAEQPEQIREITPEQIAWREQSEREKRRVWLAGTVNAEQTAVLDVAGLKLSLRAKHN